MQRVAILGLGIMGGGMAANWLAKGFEVSVWNRTRAKAEPLAAKGAKVAATPRDAAQGADFIFAMVSDDDASRSVWLGPDGALAGAKSGAIGVESSTLTPDWIRELARQAQAKGVGFLDAPVGGSRPAAGAGELRFFVGGDPQTYEAARPALAAVGSKMDLLGPVGAGATWKLINNQLAAGQVAALAEALEVAKKAGFKRRANLRAHPRRRAGEPDRQAQAAAHASAGFRAGGFRAQSHAEGRALCGGARAVAWRAGRHDRGRGEGVRARRREGAGRQGHCRGRRLKADRGPDARADGPPRAGDAFNAFAFTSGPLRAQRQRGFIKRCRISL